jgi:hypothetical protein
MCAQHHQVLPAATRVLLAAAAQLQDFAEPAVGDQLAHAPQPRTVARLVGDGQLDVVTLARCHHLVGLGQGAAHRLFEQDAGTGLGAGEHHVAVAVGVARGDADDLRPLLLEHLPVVGVGVAGAEALDRGGTAGLVVVGDGDDLDVGQVAPDNIHVVAIVAAAGAANDGDAVAGHVRAPWGGQSVGRAIRPS